MSSDHLFSTDSFYSWTFMLIKHTKTEKERDGLVSAVMPVKHNELNWHWEQER